MKLNVYGLKGSNRRWFYVAACSRCDWSVNWDGEMSWDYVREVAELHWWLYVDTTTCSNG